MLVECGQQGPEKVPYTTAQRWMVNVTAGFMLTLAFIILGECASFNSSEYREAMYKMGALYGARFWYGFAIATILIGLGVVESRRLRKRNRDSFRPDFILRLIIMPLLFISIIPIYFNASFKEGFYGAPRGAIARELNKSMEIPER